MCWCEGSSECRMEMVKVILCVILCNSRYLCVSIGVCFREKVYVCVRAFECTCVSMFVL